jgi:glycosyltransferase involved in cell wall biosynthesis
LLDFLEAAGSRGIFSEITVLVTPEARRNFTIPAVDGIKLCPQERADRSLLYRMFLVSARFDAVARRVRADVVLSLNGVVRAPSVATALLIQQPLPFYRDAAARFGWEKRLRFRILGILMGRAGKTAALVFVQSHEMKRRVAEQLGVDNSRLSVHTPSVVAYEGVQLSSEVAAQMLPVPADRRFLYVGSDDPHKNLPVLLAGVTLLREALPGAVLFVTLPFGHWAAATEGVQCLGALEPSDLATAYKLATVVCQPSLAETVGLPQLEAMSVGTPVLAADRPFAHEMCLDAARFFDPNDPASFASEALRLVSDLQLMRELGDRGRAIMVSRQDSDPYGRMVTLLGELAAGRPAGASRRPQRWKRCLAK